MDESKPTLALSDVNNSTWGDRLLLNLFSYSLVLGPMMFIVLATRYRLCPSPIQSSVLIQRFVYGTVQESKPRESYELNATNVPLLLNDTQEIERKPGAKETKLSNTTLSFIWCFVGLQLSYLIWGVLQEKIMTTEYPVTNGFIEKPKHLKPSSDNLKAHNALITFHDSQFLVFINRIIAFILSIVALIHNRPKQSQLYSRKHTHQQHPQQTKPQAPLYEYIYCSLSNILSSWCQYEALKYVNFPTQVLSKTCKIIPVMLMSKIMLHKRYQYMDYFFALLLSIGMFIFIMFQSGATKPMTQLDMKDLPVNISLKIEQGSHGYGPRFDELSKHLRSSALISGLIILALYLGFDSFTSNWQQSMFTRYGISNWQMMAATNFYSIVLTLTSLQRLGTLKPAFKLLASSSPLLIDCLLMSIMSSIGQLFVYYTIKKFGSVIFTVMMTFRQFLAILLSCAIYGHRLTLGSSVGLLLVFCVVGFQKWRKPAKSTTRRGGSKAEASDSIRIQFKPLAE